MAFADGRLFSDVSSRHLSCEAYRDSSRSVLLCFVETLWQCNIVVIATHSFNTMLFKNMEMSKNMDSSHVPKRDHGPLFRLSRHLNGSADQLSFKSGRFTSRAEALNPPQQTTTDGRNSSRSSINFTINLEFSFGLCSYLRPKDRRTH